MLKNIWEIHGFVSNQVIYDNLSFMCPMQAQDLNLYKSDHQYPGVNGTDLPVAVLYAEIGTRISMHFIRFCQSGAQEGKLVYVLRHFVSVSISSVISS